MSEIDKEYEEKVLQMVIHQYLSKTVTITEQNLESVEANKEEVFRIVKHIISEISYLDEEEITLETEVFTVAPFFGGGFSSEPLEGVGRYYNSSRRPSKYLLCTEWNTGDSEGVEEATKLLIALEKAFQIEIPESDIEYFSVDELVDYILKKINI